MKPLKGLDSCGKKFEGLPMIGKAGHHNRAFTLIEIIITLTVTAVLAAMIYTYFGKAFSESVTPITRLRTSASLQRVMENIRADYNVYPKWRSGAAYAVDALVIPTNFNGHYYKSSGGTSGTAEPNWPKNSTGTVTDGGITWTESGMPWTSTFLKTLKVKIGPEGSDQTANDYGKNPDRTTYTKYHIDRNSFTRFDNYIDQDSRDVDGSGNNKILKVTLKNDNGETLTALFFPQEK